MRKKKRKEIKDLRGRKDNERKKERRKTKKIYKKISREGRKR